MVTATASSRHLSSGAVLALVLVFTLASALGTNPYQYGVVDTSITIPFVKALVDPRLYPGDYLLQQRSTYYTYLWNLVALVRVHLGIPLPAIFFALYLAALYATYLAIYLIAKTLFEDPLAGVLSLVLLLFNRPTLGAVEPIARYFTTRQFATPLLLFALYCLLDRRLAWSFLLVGLAYLIHPLTANYVLAMVIVVAIVEFRSYGVRTLLAALLGFLLVASPMLLWVRRTRSTLPLVAADPRWLATLRLRSPHHMFPLTWGWTALVRGFVLLFVLLVTWPQRNRVMEEKNRVVAWCVGTIVALWIAGVVFSELFPWSAVLVGQPLRSSQFMEYFAILYVANNLTLGVEHSERWTSAVSPIVFSALLFIGMPEWARALGVFLGAVLLMTAGRLIARRPLLVPRMAFSLMVLAAIAGVLCFARDRGRTDRTTFSTANAQRPEWLEVQRWARENTRPQDAFIVPPLEDGEFRVESERTIYADWEDGGLMNSDPRYGLEWLRRMKMLGFRRESSFKHDYCALDSSRVEGIAHEMALPGRRVFLVIARGCGPPGLPLRYHNSRYDVREAV